MPGTYLGSTSHHNSPIQLLLLLSPWNRGKWGQDLCNLSKITQMLSRGAGICTQGRTTKLWYRIIIRYQCVWLVYQPTQHAEGSLVLKLCLAEAVAFSLPSQIPFHRGWWKTREDPTENQITDEQSLLRHLFIGHVFVECQPRAAMRDSNKQDSTFPACMECMFSFLWFHLPWHGQVLPLFCPPTSIQVLGTPRLWRYPFRSYPSGLCTVCSTLCSLYRVFSLAYSLLPTVTKPPHFRHLLSSSLCGQLPAIYDGEHLISWVEEQRKVGGTSF